MLRRRVLVTCSDFLSHFSTEIKSDTTPFLPNVRVDSQAAVGKVKIKRKHRRETEPLIPSKTVNHAE